MRDKAPPTDVWVDDRVAVGPSGIAGDGLFATSDLAAGTTIIRLGGRLVSSTELDALIAAANAAVDVPYVDTITVYEDAHLVLPPGTIAHFANHSCDPTLWHTGPYDITTRRAIRAGEELTVDYGTSSGASGFAMTCHCGSPMCRSEVSSNDWSIRELQQRYGQHWVPALQDRIGRS